MLKGKYKKAISTGGRWATFGRKGDPIFLLGVVFKFKVEDLQITFVFDTFMQLFSYLNITVADLGFFLGRSQRGQNIHNENNTFDKNKACTINSLYQVYMHFFTVKILSNTQHVRKSSHHLSDFFISEYLKKRRRLLQDS